VPPLSTTKLLTSSRARSQELQHDGAEGVDKVARASQTNGVVSRRSYKIDPGYDQQGIKVVKEQLAKAAVRLAWVLKENLQ
jgi:hypothetical protein